MSERYRTVVTKFRGVSDKALFVDRPSLSGASRSSASWPRKLSVSIPRSLIHGGDDLKLERYAAGEEIAFRLMDWKAEEIGFA